MHFVYCGNFAFFIWTVFSNYSIIMFIIVPQINVLGTGGGLMVTCTKLHYPHISYIYKDSQIGILLPLTQLYQLFGVSIHLL